MYIFKKTLIIIILIFFTLNLFSQKNYKHKWKKLPSNWKFALFFDSINQPNNDLLKYIFEEDSLFLENSNINNLEYLNLFKNLSYINLSENNINNIQKNIEAYKYNFINLENNEISYTKICEFKYNYYRGEFFYTPEFNNITILDNFSKNEIIVNKHHFEWWNNLDDNWKILLEKNSNIYIKDYNDISSDELKQILNIEIFTCINSDIDNVKPLSELTNLVILECSKNNIVDLEPLTNLTKLGILNCSNNLISDLKPLKNLTNIEVLNISKNKITDIKNLENSINLEFLDCSSNQISDLVSIINLKKLNNLNIAYNLVNEINFINKLENLQNLIVSDFNNKKINNITNKKIQTTNLDKGKSALLTSIIFTLIYTSNFLLQQSK